MEAFLPFIESHLPVSSSLKIAAEVVINISDVAGTFGSLYNKYTEEEATTKKSVL